MSIFYNYSGYHYLSMRPDYYEKNYTEDEYRQVLEGLASPKTGKYLYLNQAGLTTASSVNAFFQRLKAFLGFENLTSEAKTGLELLKLVYYGVTEGYTTPSFQAINEKIKNQQLKVNQTVAQTFKRLCEQGQGSQTAEELRAVLNEYCQEYASELRPARWSSDKVKRLVYLPKNPVFGDTQLGLIGEQLDAVDEQLDAKSIDTLFENAIRKGASDTAFLERMACLRTRYINVLWYGKKPDYSHINLILADKLHLFKVYQQAISFYESLSPELLTNQHKLNMAKWYFDQKQLKDLKKVVLSIHISDNILVDSESRKTLLEYCYAVDAEDERAATISSQSRWFSQNILNSQKIHRIPIDERIIILEENPEKRCEYLMKVRNRDIPISAQEQEEYYQRMLGYQKQERTELALLYLFLAMKHKPQGDLLLSSRGSDCLIQFSALIKQWSFPKDNRERKVILKDLLELVLYLFRVAKFKVEGELLKTKHGSACLILFVRIIKAWRQDLTQDLAKSIEVNTCFLDLVTQLMQLRGKILEKIVQDNELGELETNFLTELRHQPVNKLRHVKDSYNILAEGAGTSIEAETSIEKKGLITEAISQVVDLATSILSLKAAKESPKGVIDAKAVYHLVKINAKAPVYVFRIDVGAPLHFLAAELKALIPHKYTKADVLEEYKTAYHLALKNDFGIESLAMEDDQVSSWDNSEEGLRFLIKTYRNLASSAGAEIKPFPEESEERSPQISF